MPTHAVLFDLDGTLLDTIEDLADSLNAMLDALGAPGHAAEAYKHFVGDGIDVLVRRVLPEDRRNEATVARGIARAREEYGRRWQAKTRPYEGVPALLDALFARGLRVGILSNKPDDFTRLTVEALLPGWSFDLVWGVGEGVPKKPDPTGALRAAAALSVDPAAIVFCGDTNTDMRTAVAAGMRPVGALWGFRDEAELTESGAAAVIARPEDLLDLL